MLGAPTTMTGGLALSGVIAWFVFMQEALFRAIAGNYFGESGS